LDRAGDTVARRRRFAALAASCGTVVLAGWVAAALAGLGSVGVESTDPAPVAAPTLVIADRAPASATTDAAGAPSAAAIPEDRASRAEVTTVDRPEPRVVVAALPAPNAAVADTPSSDFPPVLSLETSSPLLTVDPSERSGVVAALSVPDAAIPATTSSDFPPMPSLEAPPPAARPATVGQAAPADPAPAVASTSVDPEAPQPAFDLAGVSATAPVEAPVPDSRPALPSETRGRLVSLFTSDPAKELPMPAARPEETPNECLVAEICIDDYLWALYERTPKVDTNKVIERIKVTVKKKGKTRTVTKTNTKYVLGDFTWKDPIAAQRAGMSLRDYVIGGMDRKFKLKLYYALRKMDEAGYMPGITSAFRDDYRQAIASGNKAASDSSYHGGSRRGGYGRGLAADLVSVKGATRMQRYAATEDLWKWIDTHEKELGVGRPYLDRDPPHVGPIDGKEYADKRGRANVQRAALQTKKAQKIASQAKSAQKAGSPTKKAQKAVAQAKKGQKAVAQAKTPQKAGMQAKTAQKTKLDAKKGRLAARNDPAATKRAKPAKSAKVSSLQNRANVQR
jgi:hypothetical protein